VIAVGAPQLSGECVAPFFSSGRYERARVLRVHTLLLGSSLWLAGCLDYNRFAREDEKPHPGREDSAGTDSALWPSFIEICDGLDNDGDGAVDEDFEDLDTNGVKDCLECDAQVAQETTVVIRDDCGPNVDVDEPWNVVLEWEVSGLGSLQLPLVAGDLDRDGVPELLVQNYDIPTRARLYVLDGRDGSVQWALSNSVHHFAGLALANLLGDDDLEILSHSGEFDAYPMMLGSAGELLWQSSSSCGLVLSCVPLVADMAGDGRPEILSGDTIFDAVSGLQRARLDGDWEWESLPAIGDIDLDGSQEIVWQGCVYTHDFQQRWCIADPERTVGSFAALIQADSDPEAELLFMNRKMGLYDTDGSALVELTVDGASDDNISAPTIADFNGDGRVKIAFSARSRVKVWGLDGTELWSRDFPEITNGLFGIVGFDFDADGANELVVTNADDLLILDGRSGTTLFSDSRHESHTEMDHPLVLDIDADGSAEIVEPSTEPDGDGVSLRVFGHADNAWPSTGTHWPSYDFQVTNIREDGSLCTEEPYPWQEWNMYRARPAGEGPRPNHTLVLSEACGGTCMDAGFIEVSFQVGNDGIRAALAGASVSLYRLDGDQRVLLDQTATQTELAPGTLGASQVLRAQVGEVRGATLQLEVVGDPSRPECDTSDDIITFDSPC
jgi:hypothetical protein